MLSSYIYIKNYDFDFISKLILIEFGAMIICILLSLVVRKLIISRLIPILIFIIIHPLFVSQYNDKLNAIKFQQAEIDGFNKSYEDFKKDKIIINFDNGDESLFSYEGFPRSIGSKEVILLEEQQLESGSSFNLVVMPGFIEQWYRSEVTIPNLIVEKQRRVYFEGDFKQELQGTVDFEREIILRDWSSRLQFYAKIKDIHIIENTAVKFMLNDQENFKQQKTYTVYMPKYIYSLLKRNKSINKYNYSNIPSRPIEPSDFLQNSQTSDNSITPPVENNTESSVPATDFASNGYYYVNASNDKLVYFYRTPNENDRKNAYFNSKDRVYVISTENGFGYVEFENSRGQKSKGWIKFTDLTVN
jgi:hypothetical protein